MNWRDPKAQMSVKQRALAAMRETVASDSAMRAPLHDLLAAFGHACAAAAERERDEWRRKALDAESHPAVVVMRIERNAARATADALLAALGKITDALANAERQLPDRKELVSIGREAIAAAEDKG